METNELTEMVRQRGQLTSDDSVHQAIKAVLTVLASRDLDGEATNLAAQLPAGIAEHLRAPERNGETFDAAEFVNRVQQQLDGTHQQAEQATHAVLSSVTDAVSEGEQLSFLNALPNDLSGYARWN